MIIRAIFWKELKTFLHRLGLDKIAFFRSLHHILS